MYTRLQCPDVIPSTVHRCMVHGIIARECEQVIGLARDGFGVAKLGVSREFVRSLTSHVKALAKCRFNGQRFPVMMFDGVKYASETMVVAIGITDDSTKRLLDLRQGANENSAI